MISPCGFRCDRCVAFKKNARTRADRVRGSAAWAKYYRLRVPPERIQCHGCLAGEVAGLDFPDKNCEIRPCVLERGLATCADCREYPCRKLESRMAACDRVVRRFRGKIPEQEFTRFIAPYDCRATLEGIGKRRAAGLRTSRNRKDR
jgi:hypothetical protein